MKKKRGLKINTHLSKKWLYVLVSIGIILIAAIGIYAAVNKAKAWHNSNNILVTVDGYTMTLQEAIDYNVFIDGATQSYTTEVSNPGHNVDKIWVSVNGNEMTLQEAISTIGLGGNTSTTSYFSAPSILAYHFASEIDVLIDGEEMSLQDAIDQGEFEIIDLNNTITAVDTAGTTGMFTSIAIGADGLPVVSYQDRTNYDLKILKCGNNACTSGNTITAVDTAGTTGLDPSMAIGADGLPIVSYYKSFTYSTNLIILKCGNNACTSGNTITTVVTNGMFSSIAIGADGLPAVSYYGFPNNNLRILKCGNNACTSGNTITVVDTGNQRGRYNSIAIGADNLPIVSYSNYGVLRILKCGNNACTSGNTITVVDTDNVGRDSSIAIGADGLPIVSYNYYDSLRILKCGNNACTSGNTITIVDSSYVTMNSITMGADNLPIVSYYDGTNRGLKILKCGNNACTSGNTITVVDTGYVGGYNSITIGADNLPAVSYYDGTNRDLKILKCGTDACLYSPS